MIRESSARAMLGVSTPEEKREMERMREATEKYEASLKAKASVLQSQESIAEEGKFDSKEDIIGHPNHYCEGRKYEPKDVIRDWELNFNLGNTVKYIARNGRKQGNSVLQDLKKARQYLDFEIAYLEEQ